MIVFIGLFEFIGRFKIEFTVPDFTPILPKPQEMGQEELAISLFLQYFGIQRDTRKNKRTAAGMAAVLQLYRLCPITDSGIRFRSRSYPD